ncbi:homeobox-leucine zipper protein MERISTEM L1-like [Impatiens glandulifera]|uniref:homeobox-leucine zipper protein MERISTEM L1-like n=1 Tax=Impatiens glandulifera TaxID=253017 RepID=UPI001FB0DFB1|nr:homeobox-leucine zipper protein MERISTEM L1-like [Impatiens glandulifera]
MDNQEDELGIHCQPNIVEVHDTTNNVYLSTNESCHAPCAKESQINSEIDMFTRASDLFMSMSIHGDFNKAKISNLAGDAAKELIQMAMEKEPLWCFVEEEGRYVLNEVEYKRRYSHAFDQTPDSILTFMMNSSENILRDDDDWYNDIFHRDFGHNCFQTEASKETGFLLMDPLDLVRLLIDVDEWSIVFSNMVSDAERIGVLSMGDELGNPNGYLQVVRGKASLLKLTDRMMRGYFSCLCSSSEAIWRPLPVPGGEDIMVTTKFNDDNDPPIGPTVVVVATIWLPKKPNIVFDFLRHGEYRNKWDLLSYNKTTQETKLVTTGSDQRNCVSLISIQGSPTMYYLQESHTDLTGFYVTFAPIDISAINKVLDGGETSDVRILSSGFSIFPDSPRMMNGEESNGSILTIAFHISDPDSLTPNYVSPKKVSGLHMIMKETVSKIMVAMIK